MTARAIVAALLLLAAAAASTALLGPCDDETTDAPTSAAPERVAPSPRPKTPRRQALTPTATADDEATTVAETDDVVVVRRESSLRVRVLDAATGAAIVGAEVSDGRPPVVTGGDGTAVLDGVLDGPCYFAVRKRGCAARHVRAILREDEVQEVRLTAGVVVPIEVADAAGRAVADASVSVDPQAKDLDHDFVRTNRSGRAEAFVAASTPCIVTTEAAGHCAAVDFVRTGAGDVAQPTVHVTLAVGGGFRGVLRGPEGAPAADGVVRLRAAGVDVQDVDVAATDGAYAFGGLALGVAHVARVDSPSGRANWSATLVFTPTAERPDVVADLRLEPPGKLALTVVDEDGADVAGARVRVFGPATSQEIRREEETLPAGEYELAAWDDDHSPLRDAVVVKAGWTTRKTLVFARPLAASGVVVDETGTPVEGALVKTADKKLVDEETLPFSRTDEQGRFALAPLFRGAHDVVVDASYDFEDDGSVRRVSAPSDSNRLVVKRRGRLSLRAAFDDDVRPPADARISFRDVGAPAPWKIDRPLPRDGRVEVAWPPHVRGDVEIAVDGCAAVTRTVFVPLGADVDLGEISFRRGAAAAARTPQPTRISSGLKIRLSGTLWVVLVDAAGAPRIGRRIVVRRVDGTETASGVTDAHGAWSDDVDVGRVVVEVEGGADAEAEVRFGDVTFVKPR